MPALEGRYDFRTAELRLQAGWAELGIYQFDPSWTGPTFTIDTPPPTVSGQIHIGHVYSYVHADIAARYHRMRGEQVLYPFGFDDNGLPTERFTERVRGIRASDVGRQAFIDACLALSEEVEAQFERFWKRLGLSVDWRLKYSTIDARSRRVAQAGFLEMYDRGQVYRQVAPTQWCPECRTAVAQADIEDVEGKASVFATILFRTTDGGELLIATTRAELLPACVAVMVHTDDERFRSLVGTSVQTPMFQAEVPVLADARVDRDKGTGAVMCCTFGDTTDVAWWREHRLPLRIVVTQDGRLNALSSAYAGLEIREGRQRILEDLASAGLVRGKQPIEHTVGVHERCGTEIEYLVAGQWFVRLLDQKSRYLEAGRRISWVPEHMRSRYENWVKGLSWDWNITRQRYYGTPFPVWYCQACETPVLAEPDQLPVDPRTSAPLVTSCPRCGAHEFAPDNDVMDTWATSSLSPDICATLLESFGVGADEFKLRYPIMSLRPNAHDIIRTWNFYTVVRSLYRYDEIPWHEVLISGHALDAQGEKISKSKSTAADDPMATLEKYSADAVRYWTAGVRTGSDTQFTEEAMRNGGRLMTKLWNAARLVLPHLEGNSHAASAELLPTDRWLLARLYETTRRTTSALDNYEFVAARTEVERFFWTDLCDNYLEMVKFRLYGQDAAAQYTLYTVLLAMLKLLAPFMPHITDEIYLACFAAVEDKPSIHVSRWPEPEDAWSSVDALRVGEVLLELAEKVRRWKSERQLSAGAPLRRLSVGCPPDVATALQATEVDLRSLTRSAEVHVVAGAENDPLELSIEG